MVDQAVTLIIADDEAPARNRLRELLADMPDISIAGEARHGAEAIELVQQSRASLVLLDIRMPQMDGIEAAGHLQKLVSPPAIIFTTAYDAYALQAFDMNAVDYLLKPIRRERLLTAINKARALLPAQLAAIRPMQPQRSHFSISERGRVLLVPVSEVIYLRAELKYTTLRTAQHEYLIEDSLNSIEQEFGERFLRLHRNCLVNPHYLLGYQKMTEGEHQWVALLKGIPETVAVSRRQLHLLKNLAG
ncbi:LytTR family DNA-binding domain-containing protein [Methylovorus menthalis]|uniref:LytR/AlgR family response regulator transcription factor n=1 Tax=Methylovorus menthalis TaxID=1002227 RepID=UPI001E65154D|nr:LytTR family DNA-binding domain-containing protein [Methylovorus menthalis]MCB4810152.1 LytTR family DNA-binding domain-containing protein [Methylovorus menthalis]